MELMLRITLFAGRRNMFIVDCRRARRFRITTPIRRIGNIRSIRIQSCKRKRYRASPESNEPPLQWTGGLQTFVLNMTGAADH